MRIANNTKPISSPLTESTFEDLALREKVLGSGMGKGKFLVYHRTGRGIADAQKAADHVKSIVTGGFKPGSGAMYGVGLYATSDLKSQFQNYMTSYGSVIIRFAINSKGFLIFDYRIAKIIYGVRYSLIDQLLLNKFYTDPDTIPEGLRILSDDLEGTFTNEKLSADRAYNIWVRCYVEGKETVAQGSRGMSQMHPDIAKAYANCNDKWKDFHTKKRIQGIVFSGNNDGNVVVCYFPRVVKPICWCLTDVNDNDPNKLLVPWTLIGDSLKQSSILGEELYSKKFLHAKTILDEVLADFAEKEGASKAADRIVRSYPWLGSRATQYVGLDVAFVNGQVCVFGGKWLLGNCLADRFGNDNGTKNLVKSVDSTKDPSESPEFFFGSFMGGFFYGKFSGGRFIKGDFNGEFAGGTWVWSKDAVWGDEAEFKAGQKCTIEVDGKSYPLTTDPATWKRDYDTKVAAAAQGISADRLVPNDIPFSDILLEKLKKNVTLSFQQGWGDGLDNADKLEKVRKEYPWLFSQALRFRLPPMIHFDINGKISLLGGEVLLGDMFFDYYDKDVKVWGGRLMKDGALFEGVMNRGVFFQGEFQGTWRCGIWYDHCIWGNNAKCTPVSVETKNINRTRIVIGNRQVEIDNAAWVDFKDMGEMLAAVKSGKYADFVIMKKSPAGRKAAQKKAYAANGPTRSGLVSTIPSDATNAKNWEDDELETNAVFDGMEDDYLDDDVVNESVLREMPAYAKLVEDVFTWSELSEEDQDALYEEFKQSYEKSVGKAFEKDDFEWRARGWEFYGSIEGGVAVRRQASGGLKLNACYGSLRPLVSGFFELTQKNKGKSIWGFMTEDIVKQLTRLTRGEFKEIPAPVAKILIPKLAPKMGADVKGVTSKGHILVDTPAGVLEKVFVANRDYYLWLISMVEDPNNANKIPVPQLIMKPMLGLLKALI